jgi:hypothetical protein
MIFAVFNGENMNYANTLPKSVFYGLLAVSIAVLAADFLFVYIPLSGWLLQAVLVSIYIEYLGLKKSILIIGLLEVFFMASYGGATALSVILSLLGSQFFVPIIVALYFFVMAIALILGYITNYIFHKIRLFERLNQYNTNHN